MYCRCHLQETTNIIINEKGIKVDPDKIRAINTYHHLDPKRGKKFPKKTELHFQIHVPIHRQM